MLIVFTATLVPATKRFRNTCVGILALQFLDVTGHLSQGLIIFQTPRSGMQSCLEAKAIELLIVAKFSAELQIVLLLGATKAEPPLFFGSIYRFSALCF